MSHHPNPIVTITPMKYVNLGAVDQDFVVYKKIIQEAYDSIKNKNHNLLVNNDPAISLYTYINYIKSLAPNYIAKFPDLDRKKGVLQAFEAGDIPTLMLLLN